MANTSMSLDKWRKFFINSNFDIFDIIVNGIMVAASDFPNDFKLKRDRIAEMLFTCKIELALPINVDGVEKSGGDDDEKYKSGVESGESKNKKESKCNYEDAEALTDEIEEESQIFEEFLRIKKILDNREEETETTLLDSLRKLQLMPMSVETLKATDIGKSVNSLRKHGSKDIRNLVKTLIEDWKTMVDDWVIATKAIAAVAEVDTESAKKTNVAPEEEEQGLPSPPMDEGVFFATPTSIELSQFFDGMDEDGNPQKNRNFIVRRSNLANVHKCKVDETLHEPKNRKMVQQKKNQEAPLCNPKPIMRPKPANNEKRTVQNRAIQKNLIPPRPKLDSYDEAAMRLETSKRKLQERYQEVKNAKKQRTIKLVEAQDILKRNVMQQRRNQPMNCIKNRGNNGRRR
ncbi:hypothetical protein ACJIZ3_005587 [Penstemon smallii]|uniref:TFIIS N-terminal domain-containing protein n=1 Tax=Penstemon smallii TaxID=265156 RepID=A0ABD3S5I6_9LAMI